MTYQIVIKAPKEVGKAYNLFEGIQNDYSLYDNCILDSDSSNKPDEIRIESTSKEMLKNLIKKIKSRYKIKRIRLIKVNKAYTIIDEGRDSETGGFPV